VNVSFQLWNISIKTAVVDPKPLEVPKVTEDHLDSCFFLRIISHQLLCILPTDVLYDSLCLRENNASTSVFEVRQVWEVESLVELYVEPSFAAERLLCPCDELDKSVRQIFVLKEKRNVIPHYPILPIAYLDIWRFH